MSRAGFTLQYDVHGHGAVITSDGNGGFTAGSPSASKADYDGTTAVQPSRVLGYDVQGNASKILVADQIKANNSPGTKIPLSNPSSFKKQISFYRTGKPDLMVVDYSKFKSTVAIVTNSK